MIITKVDNDDGRNLCLHVQIYVDEPMIHDDSCLKIVKLKPIELQQIQMIAVSVFSSLSSHNHGSETWVPPIVVTFQMQLLSTSMIVGERVNQVSV